MNRELFRVVTIGLLLQGLLSCGGGSGGEGSGPSSSGTDAVLTSVSAENLATNAAAALPGCSYISESDVIGSPPMPSMAFQSVVDTVLGKRAQAATTRTRSAATRATEINETVAGTCLVPGSYTETGTHDSGVDDLTITFDNYCVGDDEGSFTIDGVLTVKDVGIPSDAGPIPQNMQLSTGSGGLDITEKDGSETFYHELELANLVYTFGNGEEAATMSNPDSITADAMTVVDGREGREYSISGLNISSYSQGDTDQVVKISSLTYTDPENGRVKIVSQSNLVIDEDGVLKEGTIKATGKESDVALILTPSATVANSFEVTLNGEGLGTMDCSAFVAGLDPDSL